MCEPWGSFLVDARGSIFAKDGVLSHSELINHWVDKQMKQTVSDSISTIEQRWSPLIAIGRHVNDEFALIAERSQKLYKPEYNWINRTIDDFNRHDFEENATSRACGAVDRYVDENFGHPERFLEWLSRGNWLENYSVKYSGLLRSELTAIPPKKIKIPGCTHSFVTNRIDDEKKIGILLNAYCSTCHLKKHTFISKEKIMEFSPQVLIPYEIKKLEIRMRRKGTHYELVPQPPKHFSFGQFADLWMKPENRIPAWQMN